MLRSDGFVSAGADYAGGTLTTPLIRFAGSHLELNLDTGGGGMVWVGILDELSRPIEGFSRENSPPLNGNSVRLPVQWSTNAELSALSG